MKRIRLEPRQHGPSGGRRRFLTRSGAMLAGAAAGPALAAIGPAPGGGVTTELMHEHGLILRVLLIYDAFRKRLSEGQDVDPKLLSPVVSIMTSAVHGHHEKIEEDIVFERLRGAEEHGEVISRLAGQHSIGRELTATIGRGVDPQSGGGADSDRLAEALGDFIDLYAPHEAREDTVVFPAFRREVSEEEMRGFREEVLEREKRLLGADWFSGAVKQIAEVERELGIHELKVKEPQ